MNKSEIAEIATRERIGFVSLGIGVEMMAILMISAGFYPCQMQEALGARGCASVGGIMMLLAGLLIGRAK